MPSSTAVRIAANPAFNRGSSRIRYNATTRYTPFSAHTPQPGTTKKCSPRMLDTVCAIVSTGALRMRLLKGWTPEDAIGLPPQTPVTNKGMSFVEITAFGRTQGLLAWSRDRRCKVTATSLNRRLQKGIPPEVAITAARFSVRRPGTGNARRNAAPAQRGDLRRTGYPAGCPKGNLRMCEPWLRRFRMTLSVASGWWRAAPGAPRSGSVAGTRHSP